MSHRQCQPTKPCTTPVAKADPGKGYCLTVLGKRVISSLSVLCERARTFRKVSAVSHLYVCVCVYGSFKRCYESNFGACSRYHQLALSKAPLFDSVETVGLYGTPSTDYDMCRKNVIRAMEPRRHIRSGEVMGLSFVGPGKKKPQFPSSTVDFSARFDT